MIEFGRPSTIAPSAPVTRPALSMPRTRGTAVPGHRSGGVGPGAGPSFLPTAVGTFALANLADRGVHALLKSARAGRLPQRSPEKKGGAFMRFLSKRWL